MNINRHNYEEFFLLYVDNELSVAERKAVDAFVKENTDLQEELLMLQQSIIKPGKIVFEEKNSLLKEGTDQLQERLLLYLDNELTQKEGEDVEALIATDTTIAAEWGILKQTKVEADSAIVFTDKASLYRKEGGKVVAFPWRKIAVAAVLIGFGVWGTVTVFNKNNGTGTVAIVKKDSGVKKLTTTPSSITQEQIAQKQATEKINSSSQKGIELQGEKHIDMTVNKKGKEGNVIVVSLSEKNNYEKSNKTNLSNVPIEKQSSQVADPGKEVILADNPVPEKINSSLKETDNSNQQKNIYAVNASLNNAEENNNNHILYIKEEKLKKTKLGKFFGKAKKLIDQRSALNNIASSISIGNYEVAIH